MKVEKFYILSIKTILHDVHLLEFHNPKCLFGYLESDFFSYVSSKARLKTTTYLGSILGAAEDKGHLLKLSNDFVNLQEKHPAKEYFYVGVYDYYFKRMPSHFKATSIEEFKKTLHDDKWIKYDFLSETLQDIKKTKTSEGLLKVGGLLFACIILTLSYPPVTNYFISKTPPIATFFASGILGTALYMFRCRWKTYYGSLEIIFGMFVATNFMFPLNESLWPYFQMMGGIYIVVRGLDNLSKGVLGTKIFWKKVFPENKA